MSGGRAVRESGSEQTEMKEPMDARVVVVSKRWEHHTKSGGFDRLGSMLSGRVVSRRPLGRWRRVERKLFYRGWRSPEHLLDYGYEDGLVEREAVAEAKRRGSGLIHYLYGDEQMHAALESSVGSGVLVAGTFHLPYFRSRERFERWEKRMRAGLAAGTAVSSELARDLNEFFGDERIRYIPHGVDTEVFRPGVGRESGGRLELAVVGGHMREFRLIHRIVDMCRWRGLPVDFVYVGPEYCHRYFTGCEGVRLLANVPEEGLVKVYQEADALLLPVEAATANNSLIEGMACGLPVMSTRCAGIDDYLDDEAGWLLENGDFEAWMRLIGQLCEDRRVLAEKAQKAREKALTFSWEVVARAYREWYGDVLG